jgi:hypothetical protein
MALDETAAAPQLESSQPGWVACQHAGRNRLAVADSERDLQQYGSRSARKAVRFGDGVRDLFDVGDSRAGRIHPDAERDPDLQRVAKRV